MIPERSGSPSSADASTPEQPYRTGRLAHLKREVFAAVFNTPIAADLPCVFVEPGLIESLQAMVERATD